MSFGEGPDLDAILDEAGAQPAHDLDGAGRIAMDAERCRLDGKPLAAGSWNPVVDHHFEHLVQALARVVDDRTGLAPRRQFAFIRVSAVGVYLTDNAKPCRFSVSLR